jgi:hypothetical protein
MRAVKAGTHAGRGVREGRFLWLFANYTTTLRSRVASPQTSRPQVGQEIGPGILTEMREAGFIADIERPAMSLDMLYRAGFAVGVRP